MDDANQNLNGSRDLAALFSGIVCRPWASTFYDQPIYHIWSHPLRRYARWNKMPKMGVVWGT